MKKIFVLLTAAFLLFACKKDRTSTAFTPQLVSITDSSPVYNYFLLRTTQVADSTDSTVQTQAVSTFLDQNGNKVPVVSINVNGRELAQNADHSLSLNYIDSANLLAEGKALAGTNLRVRVTGTNGSDTATSFVYLPKKIVEHPKEFLDSPIHMGLSIPLTWIQDTDNPLGYVTIQVLYDGAKSQLNDPSLPPQIDPLVYRVADNGSYTISDNALSNFPAGSYLVFRIARVSEIKSSLPVSGKKVYYWGISDVVTPSLLLNQPVK